MMFLPFESWESELSNGKKLIKNGAIQVRRLKGVRQTEGCIIVIFMMLFRFLPNFLNIDPFLTSFVPFESSQSQLSNGTKMIK